MKQNCLGFATMLAGILIAIILAPAALAHPVSDDTITTPEGKIRAGMTPDNFLHFFDRMFDNIGLAFAFDKEKKADKALEVARERLMETRLMVERNNPKAAGIAQAEHARSLSVVEDSVRGIHFSDTELELEKEIEFEHELAEHKIEIEMVRNGLERLAPAEQQALANLLLPRLQLRADEAEVEIELEKENSIIKLKAETGKSDDEIRLIVKRLEDSADRSRGRGGMAEVVLGDDSGRNRGPELSGRDAENELRGREFEAGEDIRGNADENEVRGRDNELGEDIRGNADENEIRGRESENEVRGREAEGEAPRGADDISDFDSTPGSRGGGSSGGSGGSTDD